MKNIENVIRIYLALTFCNFVAPSFQNWRLKFIVQNGSKCTIFGKNSSGMVKNEFFTIYKISFEIFTHWYIVLEFF